MTAAPEQNFFQEIHPHVEKIIIVGSGASSATPKISCATSGRPCAQCAEALRDPSSPNHRLNPSLLVQMRDENHKIRNVLVDCGKTFRESAFKVLCPNRVQHLDAVLITHDHMDACLGIDDLREFSRKDEKTRLYSDSKTMKSLKRIYPFLAPPDGTLPKSPSAVAGPYVAQLDWIEMPMGPFDLFGVTCFQFYVEHGKDYLMNCFAFPVEGGHMIYMSDVSEVPEEIFGFLASLNPKILVLDMLGDSDYPTHLGTAKSKEISKRIAAEKTFFVGMSHGMNYEKVNQKFLTEDPQANWQLARDGLVLFQSSIRIPSNEPL